MIFFRIERHRILAASVFFCFVLFFFVFFCDRVVSIWRPRFDRDSMFRGRWLDAKRVFFLRRVRDRHRKPWRLLICSIRIEPMRSCFFFFNRFVSSFRLMEMEIMELLEVFFLVEIFWKIKVRGLFFLLWIRFVSGSLEGEFLLKSGKWKKGACFGKKGWPWKLRKTYCSSLKSSKTQYKSVKPSSNLVGLGETK